jgi:hypothetical protein
MDLLTKKYLETRERERERERGERQTDRFFLFVLSKSLSYLSLVDA